MCFSASASFTASGVLAVAGIIAITKKRGPFWPIALIPLFFAIQQFFEGLVWVYWAKPFIWIYLFFAVAFWPIWIPLALTVYDHAQRQLYIKFLIWGVLVALFGYGDLLFHSSLVDAKVVSHSICYILGCFRPSLTEVFLYAVATILPLLISTSPHLRILGALMLVSALVSYLFYFYAFASVWCFFAAIISLYIVFLSWRI